MNDLIERQAAIDAICEAFCYAYCDNCEKELDEDLCGDCHRKYQNWSASRKTVEKVINALPSAQTMRKKGRWKRRLVDSGFNADWYCSKCGWKTALEEHGYNYCPHCGADMRGEKANENNIQ